MHYRNPEAPRPQNLRPHLSFKALHDTSVRIPEELRRYQCNSCGFVGNTWEMDYTTCTNFSPPHDLSVIKKATRYDCTLCGYVVSTLERPVEWGICQTKGLSHGWLTSIELDDNGVFVCKNCGRIGSRHILESEICPNPDLEPCEYCNIVIQCAADCPGIGAALGELISRTIDDHEGDETDWGQTWSPDEED